MNSPSSTRIAHGRRAGFVAVLKATFAGFSKHRCAMMGSSIAFYSAFSLAPTLLIVLAVVGWFFGRDAARGRIFGQVKDVLGADAAAAMQTIVEHAHYSRGGGIAAVISVVLLGVGASATFSSLNTALDVVFGAPSAKGLKEAALLLRARLVSLGLVMGLAFLLVVSLVVNVGIETVGKALFGSTALGVVADVGQAIFGLIVLTVGLGALIKWLPDTPVPLRSAFAGGFVAALLFTAGRHLFVLYLSHAGTAGAFGAAGSLAVLMMWLYFSAAVFLLGAEVTAALAGKPKDEQVAPPSGGASSTVGVRQKEKP